MMRGAILKIQAAHCHSKVGDGCLWWVWKGGGGVTCRSK